MSQQMRENEAAPTNRGGRSRLAIRYFAASLGIWQTVKKAAVLFH